MIANGEPRETDNTGTQKENQDTSLLEKPMTELSHVEDLTSFTCQPEEVTVPAPAQKSITTGKAKDANGHKARWILIKINGGEAVPAKSTNFDYWAVTFTGNKDHDYIEAKSDIPAYEVFERQEPAPHRKTQRLATLSDRQMTGDGASTLELRSKADAQSAMQTMRQQKVQPLITQDPTEALHPQTSTHQSGEDTRDSTGKTFMEQMTNHRKEGEDNEEITSTRRAPQEIPMASVERTLQEGTPQDPRIATPTLEGVPYEEMLELAIQASIKDSGTPISQDDTLNSKLSDEEMLELAIQASIKDSGTPISLDDTLNSKLSDILIPNIKDSCYVVNGAITLAATLQGQALTSARCSETGGLKSELLQMIDARLLQPINSTMALDNPGKALHISESTITDIRKKCQQWGWTHPEGQQCVSEFLAFLWDAFGMADHSIETIEQAPDRPDEISKGKMGTLHLAIPLSDEQSGNTLRPVELTHLIQKTLSPEINIHNNVTTTVNIQKLSDTLIIHAERVISGQDENLWQRCHRRVVFPENLPIEHLLTSGNHAAEKKGQLKLKAVICHKGGQNFNSGHFFTIMRTKVPGSHTEKWVKLDDLCPRSIEVVKDQDWLINESIQSGAHIWIYERENQTDTVKPDMPRDQGAKAQVFIQCMSGSIKKIDIPIQSTIKELKLASSLLESTPVDVFDMIYGSKWLLDEKTLPYYGIIPGSTIQMRMGLRGGAQDEDQTDNEENPHSSWMMTSSTNPQAFEAHLRKKQATQGNLQGLWKDEDIPAQGTPERESDNTKVSRSMETNEMTRRIYDHSTEPVIQPAGVGGFGGIFPQSRITKQGENFTTSLQWNVVTSCPGKGCIVNPYILTPGIPTLKEATRVYDWMVTRRAVQKNLHRDQPIPTFHDDRSIHTFLWSMATIHEKLESQLDGAPHHIRVRQLTESWAEGGDPNPALRENIKLLHDGWIREYTMKTHSQTFYEFILPASGREEIVNGARFETYGPWTTLEEACHTREWLAMILFAGRTNERKIFPLRVSIPNDIITVPSLFDDESQRKLRLIFYTHRLTIRQSHIREPPSQDILSGLGDPNSFPSRCLSRATGILVAGEAVRRMFFRIDFLRQAEIWGLHSGARQHATAQHLNGSPTSKRYKQGIVTLASPIKESISKGLQTLLLLTGDWALVTMADGTGKLQRSAYIPDQTTQLVSSSPLKYLLLRNLEEMEFRRGDTDFVYLTLKRDLQKFLALETPWAPHSEFPQTRALKFGRQETDSLDLHISIQRSKQACEEQPVIIVQKSHLLRSMGDYSDDEEVRELWWNPYGVSFVERLHKDCSGILDCQTRCEALCITHHSMAPNLDLLFSSTGLHVRIQVTKSLNLKRSFYLGERGREGLVNLLASHQQPLWRLLENIANSAKLFTITTAFVVHAHQIPSLNRVVLQLQLGRGSSNASQGDLDKANTELSDESNQSEQVGQLAFLALYAQGATIYLTHKTSEPTPPAEDSVWDWGWLSDDSLVGNQVGHQSAPSAATLTKSNIKRLQKMNKLMEKIRFYPGVCPHCNKMVEVAWMGSDPFTEASPYPPTYVCPLRNLLLVMLARFGLQEISYLFEIVHTLSELCTLVKSGPRKGAQGPDLPIPIAQKSRLWLLVTHLQSSYPQHMRIPMEETPSPHEKNQAHISTSLWNTTPMELGQFVNHDISRDILPVEKWSTVEVANILIKKNLVQTAQTILQYDINGQTLTELIYSFDQKTSKLCCPTGIGGFGLSNEAVVQIRTAIDEFTRTYGFIHYSAVSPWSRRLTTHRTIRLKITTGIGLGAPGILSPGQTGTFYQSIALEAPTQLLRALLSARQDVGSPANDCLLIYKHQENDRYAFLERNESLQTYGIVEGSEIFLRQFPAQPRGKVTEDAGILFEKDNVHYESGELVQLRSSDDRPSFGLMLGRQDDRITILWAYERREIAESVLWTSLEEYDVPQHDRELFLSNRLSLEPLAQIMCKASVSFLDWRKGVPNPLPTQHFFRFRYRFSAPHPSTWTVEEASENLRALGCARAAELLIENSINGKTLFSADFQSYLTMAITMGGLGLTDSQRGHLKDLEQNGNIPTSIEPLTKDWLDREKRQHSETTTLGNEPHHTPRVLFELLDDKYRRDDYVLFLTPEGEAAIGNLRSMSEKYMITVKQMYKRSEVREAHLNTLEKEHGVTLLKNEIFYTECRTRVIPCRNVIRKVQVWTAGKCDDEWLAEAGTFEMNMDQDYLIRFSTPSMDFDMAMVPLAADMGDATRTTMDATTGSRICVVCGVDCLEDTSLCARITAWRTSVHRTMYKVNRHNPQHPAWLVSTGNPDVEAANSTPLHGSMANNTSIYVRSLGIAVTRTPQGYEITGIAPDSPAENDERIRRGHLLLKIGESSDNLRDIDSVGQALQGPPLMPVTLLLGSPLEPKTFQVTLIRQPTHQRLSEAGVESPRSPSGVAQDEPQQVGNVGLGSNLLHIRLRRLNGTEWKITVRADSETTVLYNETHRVTNILRDGFYLEYNGKVINERESTERYNIQQNSTVLVILRSRGGGDHLAGSKKKKNPQDRHLRAFEEAAKNLRMDKAQRKEEAGAAPQEPLDMAQLLARRDKFLLDGKEKEKERVAATKAVHDRQSNEEAVNKDILSTLAIHDKLSPEEEEELRVAIIHTQNTLKTQRAPGRLFNHALITWMLNKHLQRIALGAEGAEKLMQALVMNPDARDSITVVLRTRSENLQVANNNGCPSEIDISTVFGQLSRKHRILTLPKDSLQDQNRRVGTDFQVDMEKARHDLTEIIKDGVLPVKEWSFDVILDPPGTERIALAPTHHDNNQAKLLAFITGARGLRSKGNEDTKIELIIFQGLKETWDKMYPEATLTAVRLEYSRRLLTKKGIQWVKPLVSALGVKAAEAPRIFLQLGGTDPSQSKDDLQRAVKEVLRSNNTINLNMVSDMDTSPDHIIAFGIRPFNDKPETGTRQAIDRSKDHIQMERQMVTETMQKVDGLLTKLHTNNLEGNTEDARNAIRSICGDLMDEDRTASSQTLGRAIRDILEAKVDPSALNDDESWRENLPQQRLVITVASGIPNLRAFFATNDLKQKLSTHKNKHTAQMFYLRKALQQRQVATETVEFIFEERGGTKPQNDSFVAIFTEETWTRLIQPAEDGTPAILTALPNTTARRLRSNEAKEVMTLDGSRKILPNLTFKAIEETEVEDNEDESRIVNLLTSGHPIFMPHRTTGDTEIHAATPLKDILDPKWAGLRIHDLDLKYPEKILMYLYNLQEKRQAQRLNIQKNVIVWMYPPLVDLLLAIGRENLLQDLQPLNAKDTNHTLIVDTLKERIKQALQIHVDKGLWLQDTPFMDAIPGIASLDGTTVPFPVSTSELEAPAVMPEGINLLLLAPTKNKCQLLLDLTMELIQELVELDSITPVQKRGHTLLIKANSDILQAVLRSDGLRVGWPINFDTLEITKEETEGALQHLLSLVYRGRGWGIVRLSVSDMADFPNFDVTDFEPRQELNNPYHISQSGSQILTLGRWIADSPALRQLKLAKGILIFNTPHPKGILWICPGKETQGQKEYRSLGRLLGRGEETDRQIHTRLQETLLQQFDSDISLLATLDKMRMDILLESIHPILEGSPAILQDHYIETDATNKETVVCHRPTLRPQIQVTWNLQPRWKASADTEELIGALFVAKTKGLLNTQYHLGILNVPQVGTLILTATDHALTTKIPPHTLLKRLVDAFRGPLTSMEELTKGDAEYEFVNPLEGAGGLPPGT